MVARWLSFLLLFTSSYAIRKRDSFPLTHSGLHDPIGSVQGLITRVLGPDYLPFFNLTVIPVDTVTGHDVFELDSTSTQPTQANVINIRGNAGYSIAAGLNWYLKYTLNTSVSWGRRPASNLPPSGNQMGTLPPPNELPPPSSYSSNGGSGGGSGGGMRIVAPDKIRYAYNVCTFGYSLVWFNFSQFEDEIDRLALWGVNLPLAFQGQEFTWKRFWLNAGFTENEVNSYLTGPAFAPWGRMGNVQQWGITNTSQGLPEAWLLQQRDLQVQIVTRMREFGMTVVLPGFAGHVPPSITTVYPNANISLSTEWAGFSPPYSPTSLLSPTDPLFLTLAKQFYTMILQDFGDPTGQETPVFNADEFNEVNPYSGDLSYLHDCNAAIYNAMVAVDPRSLYMIQAWTFGFEGSFWTYDRVQAFLSGVPIGKLLVLDLHTSDGPMWSSLDSYFGHLWVWNALMNGGQQNGLFGETNVIASGPYTDRQNASSTMAGVGFTPEGIWVMPSQYDLMMEAGWRNTSVDPSEWYTHWATRRYGIINVPSSSSLAVQATLTLMNAAFNSGPNSGDSVASYPAITDGAAHAVDADGVLEGFRLLTAAGITGEVDTSLGPYSFDMTDTHRQFLVDLFSDAHAMLAARYATAIQTNASIDAASVVALAQYCTGIFLDLDQALSADINFKLGNWIQDAASWGGVQSGGSNTSIQDTDLYVFNALNQVTLWGPHGEINDYAAKSGWADMIKGYYLVRWQVLFDALVNASQVGSPPRVPLNLTQVNDDIYQFELAWNQNTSARYPTEASGEDVVVLASASLEKYATLDTAVWEVLEDTDVALPPRNSSVNFVFLGPPGSVAVSADCPYTGQVQTNDLAQCEAACRSFPSCNVLNLLSVNSACIFRLCVNPRNPQMSPGSPAGWVSYGMNTTEAPIISATWHHDPGVLSKLCDSDSAACAGFNSNGLLLTNVTLTTPSPGTRLYIRRH